jgi:WD40 repeat protein
VLSGHTDPAWGCAFSPDGALLATTSTDQTVRLWTMPEGSYQKALTGHTERVTACSFSPNGDLLATTSWDGTVRLWQTLVNGTPILTPFRHLNFDPLLLR